MARQIRIEYPGAFYHIVTRGYGQMWIFHDEQDFLRIKEDLSLVFHSHCLVIHAYCIMHNHIHLFAETPQGNLQKAMHRLLVRYAAYYKTKYKLRGKVFEKKYSAFLVNTDEYALDLSRYIHRNPVNVIVKDPLSWQHSSFRDYQGFSSQLDFLFQDLLLKRFDIDETLAKDKMAQHMNREEASVWHPEDYLQGNTILGSKEFVERIRHLLPEETNNELSGLIVLNNDMKIKRLKSYVSKLNISMEEKLNLMMYALRKKTSLTSKEINKVLSQNLSRSTMSHRIKKIQEISKKNPVLAQSLIDLQQI